MQQQQQGWKFMLCSQCQKLCQQGSWLLIGSTQEWTTNKKPGSASWPNFLTVAQTQKFPLQGQARVMQQHNNPGLRQILQTPNSMMGGGGMQQGGGGGMQNMQGNMQAMQGGMMMQQRMAQQQQQSNMMQQQQQQQQQQQPDPLRDLLN